MATLVTIRPYEESVDPAFMVKISLSLPPEWAPIAFEGDIRCNERVIAQMCEEMPNGTSLPWTNTVSMVAPLSRKSLDFLEMSRDRHPHHDVVLEVRLRYRALMFSVLEADVFDGRPTFPHAILEKAVANQRPSYLMLMLYRQGDLHKQAYTNMEVLQTTIAGSKWAHGFAPAFGLGRTMTYEIPQPVALTTNDVAAEVVNAALRSMSEAEQKVRNGEWLEACQALRGVFELLSTQKGAISGFLRADGYTDAAISDFEKATAALFQLVSKFSHKTDRQGSIKPDISPSKEDALLIYGLAAGALNLVARKVARQT